MNNSDLELYFTIETDTDYVVRPTRLTQRNVQEALYRCRRTKFSTNDNDGYNPNVLTGQTYYPDFILHDTRIYVFLRKGKEDTVRYYERIVTKRDLLILGESFSDNEPELPTKRFHMKRRYGRKFRGKVYTTSARHSYAKNSAKNFGIAEDYKELIPDYKRSKNRLREQAKFRNSWDFYDYTEGRNSNGWKKRTTKRSQYMRHQK